MLGFVLALIIVTFLHLVVGEMAPKSWAIAHPEKSATMLAIPMRGFMLLTRPLLKSLNKMANWCLLKVGVEPVDQVGTGQDPDALRHLVEHSANVGTLDAGYSAQLSGALEMQTLTVRDLLPSNKAPTSVTTSATMNHVRSVSKQSGHLRILVATTYSSRDRARSRHPAPTRPHPRRGHHATGVHPCARYPRPPRTRLDEGEPQITSP